MKPLLQGLCVLGLVVGWSAGEAGTITIAVQGTQVVITTTANQDTFLGKLKDQANSAQGTTWTTNEYIQDLIVDTFQGKKQEADHLGRTKACTKYNDPATTNAQRNAIVGVLGENPCP